LKDPTQQGEDTLVNSNNDRSSQLLSGPRVMAFPLGSGSDINSSDDIGPLAVQCANKAMDWARFNEEKNKRPNEAARFMHYRTRLAYLTDDIKESEEKWNTDVRAVADKLQDAIQDTAEYVFSTMKLSGNLGDSQSLVWSTTCQLENPRIAYSSTEILPIHFVMFRRDSQWVMSKNQLEATLGLWSWSLKKFNIDLKRRKSFMLSTESERHEVESLIHLWVIRTRGIEPEKVNVPYDLLSKSNLSADSQQEPTATPESSERSTAPCGPNHPTTLSVSLRSLLCKNSKPALLFWIPTKSSPLQLVAQDIFTIFISRIADLLEPLHVVEPRSQWSGSGPMSEPAAESSSLDRPYLGITNPHIRSIADIFAASGIGSVEDALTSIIPPLLQRSKLPRLDKIAETLLSTAKSLK
jgi:hypothetical protein